MLRILGGSRRGKKLKGPSGLAFRPATGRVKSFVFEYFKQDIAGSRVLDLFAGTGSLGIEALSRGAAHCTFVEQDNRILSLNLDACGFAHSARLVRGDVFKILPRLAADGRTFDFILADPPFKESLRERIAQAVDRNRLLEPNGLLIIEHDIRDPDRFEHGLKLLKQKRFGHCVLSVYGYAPLE